MSDPLLIPARQKDLGGFSVGRVLPHARCRQVGPWVFFDHMGPATFTPGKGINVRPHPHINLATVTYLFSGEILHRDSLGSLQTIEPGAINLMVAGRGIVHSERERPEREAISREIHGLQLWLALPTEDEEIEPAFYHYPSNEIPAGVVNDVPVRVMMGKAWGMHSPVKTYSPTFYAEAALKAGQSIPLSEDIGECAVYVVSGALEAAGNSINQFQMAVLPPGKPATITANTDTQIALIGGETVGPRYIDWNFVSSRKHRIEEAKKAWKQRRFPLVPGDEEEFIPLPG